MSLPHIVIQQDLIREFSQPQENLVLIPGISVKALFEEKMVLLLHSVCLSSCWPPAAVHHLHSNKNPAEILASGGGHTSYTGELQKPSQLCT